MKSYFYSKQTNGFYPESMKEIYEASPDGWPSDAVAIEDEYYDALYMGQSQGKIITSDSEGKPVLTDPPAPTQEQLVALAEEKRNTLIAEATVKIAPLQDAVDLDEASEEEKNQLISWKKYRILLNRTDTSTAPNITWPERG